MHSTRAGISAEIPLRAGCDLHPVAQVEQSIATFGDRYLERVFTPAELAECRGDIERLAGRFAGKEAVLKVLRPSQGTALPWPTIEVLADGAGAPHVVLHGRAHRFAAEQGITTIELSLSHDAGMALAFAVAALLSGPRPLTAPGKDAA